MQPELQVKLHGPMIVTKANDKQSLLTEFRESEGNRGEIQANAFPLAGLIRFWLEEVFGNERLSETHPASSGAKVA